MSKPGSKTYKVEYLEGVVREDIPNLPKTVRELVKRAIETRLAVEPIALGKPLRYSFVGHRRIRVGDYRIVYRVDEKTLTVIIAIIKHRKDVYGE
ncbi:type II toxin-antitoxin system RelE/ParE family toxin [bacterium]|jgi:mRNA interferase RelE/StbE|nr:type II toxin-antitoxin system RelE/ParE family toxin [bacterium]